MTSIEKDWFKIDLLRVNGKDAYKWAAENIHGAWVTNRFLRDVIDEYYEIDMTNSSWLNAGNFPFWFALESDAFAFKLRWV